MGARRLARVRGGAATVGWVLAAIAMPTTAILILDWFDQRVGIWVTLGLIAAGVYLYDSGRKRGRWEGPEDD
jgi:hypothetical protein